MIWLTIFHTLHFHNACMCIQQAIEEALKITLSGGTDSNPSPKISTPDLNSLRDKLSDPAARMWSLFYDNQKKTTTRADVER